MNTQELINLNGSYHQKHYLTKNDTEKVNKIIDFINGLQEENKLQNGDIIRLTTRNGRYYHNARIDSIGKYQSNKASLCEQPYIPFISCDYDNKEFSLSMSGGAFQSVDISKLKYLGTEKALFKVWGHCGACGNGAINFYVNVNVWEYKEDCRYKDDKNNSYTQKERRLK